jgi:putative restriction endonuclease
LGEAVRADTIQKRFDKLNIWRQGDQRAPHKPLLVLYALGMLQQRKAEVTFKEVEPKLTALLREFGPYRRSDHPEQPFWRLQNDGVWTVKAPNKLPLKKGDDIPRVMALRWANVRAGFSEDVQAALAADPKLITQIAVQLLEKHFPESLHQDILNAVGLTLEVAKKKRDPTFRDRVLKAYEYRCAVCGFDVRLGSQFIALDAAHIRWHQAGGPDAENNGLALCAIHHKVFDLGAFTLGKSGRLLVSDQVTGSAGFEEVLMHYHGKPVRKAQRPEWRPELSHLEWHTREVFKGKARYTEMR